MFNHTVSFGENRINFILVRKDVKNINLNIRPDTSIMVSAHAEVPLEIVEDFIRQKGPWIAKKINYFKAFRPEVKNEKEYVSGESFKYLGRQYRLKVQKSDKAEVKYFRGLIYLYVQDTRDFKKKEMLFKEWLYKKSQIHYNDSLDRMYRLVGKYNIPKPMIRIRVMSSRWGSCHRKDKVITLNSELIKAPKHCIDYVVLHELIHFKYKNHDNRFYTFLMSFMPDWEFRKKILDEEVWRDL